MHSDGASKMHRFFASLRMTGALFLQKGGIPRDFHSAAQNPVTSDLATYFQLVHSGQSGADAASLIGSAVSPLFSRF